MSNILKFPQVKRETSWLPKSIITALNQVPDDLANEIKSAFEEPVRRYEKQLFECISLELPHEITPEQRSAIEKVIIDQREAIKELVQELGVTKANAVFEKYRSI